MTFGMGKKLDFPKGVITLINEDVQVMFVLQWSRFVLLSLITYTILSVPLKRNSFNGKKQDEMVFNGSTQEMYLLSGASA